VSAADRQDADAGGAEERTQREVREQAELAPDDADTSREELELDLMEENESERGERLG
jgi:hypothetical protein